MVELAIITAQGVEVIDTYLLHDRPWSKIYEESSPDTRLMMELQKKKFQWDNNYNFPPGTKLVNARQVASILHDAQCDHPEARFVEHTLGNADIKRLRRFLHDNGGRDWVLNDHGSFGLLKLWRDRLPGSWSCSQDDIFALTRPDHPLAAQAHRAMVDATKLHILLNDLIADCTG